MNRYRITIRFGAPRAQYEVLDVEAATLREALRRVADEFPEAAAATADLVEVRLHTEPDARGYAPG